MTNRVAREKIRSLLREEPDVELIGTCDAGEPAIEFIRREHPGLVFLEPRLPDMDGLEVMRHSPQADAPVTIFTTSDDSHALRAFEAGAVDYLLKPFTSGRFKEAVQRARDCVQCRSEAAPAPDTRGRPREWLSRLLIKDGNKIVVVKTAQIDSIESAGNYVAVHVGKAGHILRKTLSTLETQLDPRRFLRISRSAIVNLDQVKELVPHFQGEHVVVLHNGNRLAMTRNLRDVEHALQFS